MKTMIQACIAICLLAANIACGASAPPTVTSNLVTKGLSVLRSDNTQVLKINTLDSYSGVGTGTSGSPRLFIGANTPTNDDSAIAIGRAVAGSSLFSHAFRDESTFTSTTTGAYASYDSLITMSGSTHYNHLRSYQARPYYNGSNLVDEVNGFGWIPIVHSGTVGNLYGVHLSNYTGSGTVNYNVGIWIDALSGGTAGNYAIYSSDPNTPSYHGGLWQVGTPGILSAGPVLGSNFKSDNLTKSAQFGTGQTALQQYNTSLFGADAGASLTAGSNGNTLIGALSGSALTTHGGNVFLGYGAGHYLTESNSLVIDNTTRSSGGEEQIYSLVYGHFGADNNNQSIRINGSLQIGTTSAAPTCDSTKGGTFWYTAGAAGVKDNVQVCAKDATNTWTWRTIY